MAKGKPKPSSSSQSSGHSLPTHFPKISSSMSHSSLQAPEPKQSFISLQKSLRGRYENTKDNITTACEQTLDHTTLLVHMQCSTYTNFELVAGGFLVVILQGLHHARNAPLDSRSADSAIMEAAHGVHLWIVSGRERERWRVWWVSALQVAAKGKTMKHSRLRWGIRGDPGQDQKHSSMTTCSFLRQWQPWGKQIWWDSFCRGGGLRQKVGLLRLGWCWFLWERCWIYFHPLSWLGSKGNGDEKWRSFDVKILLWSKIQSTAFW